MAAEDREVAALDSPAVEALRRQLQESLYPTLAAAVGVGFVLAGSGTSELGKIMLRLAGRGAAPTLRMIAATLAKIDPDKARAALDLEARLGEPVDINAAVSELTSMRPRRRTITRPERPTGERGHAQRTGSGNGHRGARRGQVSRRS